MRTLVLPTAVLLMLATLACAFLWAEEEPRLDADAEKVLVLADFESDGEIANVADSGRVPARKGDAPANVAVWIGAAAAKWQANKLEISDEHVFHGKHSLKVTVNEGVGHGWSPTVDRSFPGDWSDYDAVRFFVHWPEEKTVQWAWFIWLRYTNAEGNDTWIQPWLLFSMKQGDSSIEIPLSAFDDLKWPGPVGGCGGGVNQTAMTLWGQDQKYEFIHRVGWKFDRVYKMAAGLRGNYDTKAPHVYWMDYIRLVKKKKN